MVHITAHVAAQRDIEHAIRRAVTLTGEVARDPQHQLPTGHMRKFYSRIFRDLALTDDGTDDRVDMTLMIHNVPVTVDPSSDPNAAYLQWEEDLLHACAAQRQ